jgi:D-3-phosphoglycerate dehydrogenase
MIRILANDGINPIGEKIMKDAGFEVVTEKVAQEDLASQLNNYDAILVRSATQVRKELIDACPNLKLIGRGGVGMDNIDVEYARNKGLHVVNTPAASSQSVAELVFAHMFSLARHLHDANRNMPSCDSKEMFSRLKKQYSKGVELKGKTLGIIGMGQIGQAVAAMAIGLGMEVLPFRRSGGNITVDLQLHESHSGQKVKIDLACTSMDDLLAKSDFITLHVPFPKGSDAIIGAGEFAKMKDGAVVINTARGGALSEEELLAALDSGKVSYAGLDVFEGEPEIRNEIRDHERVSLSPHIGGSTAEAQSRIGSELAEKVVSLLS